jgi:hypothetical protein
VVNSAGSTGFQFSDKLLRLQTSQKTTNGTCQVPESRFGGLAFAPLT